MNIHIQPLFLVTMIAANSVIMSGCVIDTSPPPPYPVPPGARYVKPGMTREQRVQDMTDCGARDGLRGNFTDQQVREASKTLIELPDGTYTSDGNIILIRKMFSCMEAKGYHKVLPSQCGGYKKEDNEVCMYP